MGEMPDAAFFGDTGSDTLGHVAACRPLKLPELAQLGLGSIRPLSHIPANPSAVGNFGKAALASSGKDTTSGHWEMMGLILEKAFPTYPGGFPEAVVEEFERLIGRRTLGNIAASGTEIISRLGAKHLETGRPIVYTSADSVFQLAAHADVISSQELYSMCLLARKLLQGPHQVARVIARPFVGQPGMFRRTAQRLDFAIPPLAPTVLDHLQRTNIPVVAIGKIASIYCYRGVDRELKARDNREVTARTLEAMRTNFEGLIFVNYGDFDTLFGHRNDIEGFGRALEEFDLDLATLVPQLGPRDLLLITSDHGCDPGTPSTDHSREYALLLAYSPGMPGGRDLGVRESLADVGATVAENFDLRFSVGASFLDQLVE